MTPEIVSGPLSAYSLKGWGHLSPLALFLFMCLLRFGRHKLLFFFLFKTNNNEKRNGLLQKSNLGKSRCEAAKMAKLLQEHRLLRLFVKSTKTRELTQLLTLGFRNWILKFPVTFCFYDKGKHRRFPRNRLCFPTTVLSSLNFSSLR